MKLSTSGAAHLIGNFAPPELVYSSSTTYLERKNIQNILRLSVKNINISIYASNMCKSINILLSLQSSHMYNVFLLTLQDQSLLL